MRPKSILSIFIIILVLFSCSIDASHFDWLVGTWERTNGKPGTKTIETWEKLDHKTYKAISLVLNNKDTLYKEHCTIKKEGDYYYYIADVPQNPYPIKFKIVEFTDQSFKAVNPQHDFPKEITYKVSDNKIIASISGGNKQVDYNFEKQ